MGEIAVFEIAAGETGREATGGGTKLDETSGDAMGGAGGGGGLACLVGDGGVVAVGGTGTVAFAVGGSAAALWLFTGGGSGRLLFGSNTLTALKPRVTNADLA